MTVTCPKCSVRGQSGERWHATGRRNTNRYGRRRAELVCDVCGYAFSSGLPAALEAAEAVSGSVEPAGETAAAGRAELTAIMDNATSWRQVRKKPKKVDFTPLQDIVKGEIRGLVLNLGDWKKKAAGDE